MPLPDILVVAVDGLRASALGAYGNTSFGTPALDHFAADSFALDWCYAAGAGLTEVYRALWHSQHPLRPALSEVAGSSLPRLLAGYGYRTTLVSDELQLPRLLGAPEFDQLVDAAPAATPPGAEPRAAHVAETAIARLFAAACEVVTSEAGESPRLVWIHSRGMYGPWDAPVESQQALFDEGDPPPVDDIAPPDLILMGNDDLDAVFRYSSAYAGQVIALDACWKGLMEAIGHGDKCDWLVVLVGARGYPLGEHRRIGGIETKLYGEQLHVPALLRFPSSLGRLGRASALASHIDLLPTLLDWIERMPPAKFDGMSWLPLVKAARSTWRDALLFGSSSGSRAIRTANWCLRQESAVGDESAESVSPQFFSELFVRPDDRWEANDVAKLCPDVVESLTHAIEHVSQRLAENAPLPLHIVPTDMPACGS